MDVTTWVPSKNRRTDETLIMIENSLSTFPAIRNALSKQKESYIVKNFYGRIQTYIPNSDVQIYLWVTGTYEIDAKSSSKWSRARFGILLFP